MKKKDIRDQNLGELLKQWLQENEQLSIFALPKNYHKPVTCFYILRSWQKE